MPIFDTPINVNDMNWHKITQQKQPVLLYLFDHNEAPLDEALKQAARTHAGELLVTRIDVSDNPQTYAQYSRPTLPALLVIKDGKQDAVAAPVQASDVDAYINYALGKRAKPVKTVEKGESGSAAPFVVSDQTFRSAVLGSDLPVLVDFWAPWCGPCRLVAPSVEAIARKYAGRVKVAKMNVDENPQTASAYQTMSIPTLILFKQNQEAGRLVGTYPQPAIEQMIERSLAAQK